METYQDLFAHVRTKDDLDELINELEVVKKSLYQVNSSLEKTLHESVREKTALELQKLFTKTGDHKAEVENILAQLAKLKPLNLKIAFEPTEKVIDRIYSWVEANIGKGIILAFEYDPQVLGGAEVAFEGKYIDLTVKKALEGYKFS